MNISLISSVQYSHTLIRSSKQLSTTQNDVQSSNKIWKGKMPCVLALNRDKRFIMAATTVDSAATSRPLANFAPSMWGDHFRLSDLEYNELITRGEDLSMKVKTLTHELKIELKETKEHPLQQLELIDTIQRLGVKHLFEEEIDESLHNIYDNYVDFYISNDDLYNVALCFRLLRQNGHKVSCEIFEKFKDVKEEFKASLTSNVLGMLEFYEATYLSIQGEDILDHGRALARAHLHSVQPNISDASIRQQVFNALDYSNRREMPRLATRKYISLYEKRASRHESLLQLAKLDFNRLQCLHKRELSELYSWWTKIGAQKNFWYSRDRFVETNMWVFGSYFEPQYAIARSHLFKFYVLCIFLDDTYDAYGTFEELQAFTEASKRWWSVPCPESLPGYMKVLYKVVLETLQEMEDEMATRGVEYRIKYAKQTLDHLVQGWFDEAKWREEKYIPGLTEYMSVSSVTCGHVSMAIYAYLGMGDVVTKESFEWALSNPLITKAANIHTRLIGDMSHHLFEQKRDHVPSAVECYMNEHGVSRQVTCDELNSLIEVAWKDINEELLRPRQVPIPLLDHILNTCRVIESMYKKGEWYTHPGPEMKHYVTQLFIDPIPE